MTVPAIIGSFDWLDRTGRTPVGTRMATPGRRGWAGFLLAKGTHLVLGIGLPLHFCGAQIGPAAILLIY